MTAFADLVPGQAFVSVSRVTGADPAAGWTLRAYGPANTPVSVTTVTPAGVITGNLAAAPADITVQLVAQFAAVSPGDILQNTGTGDTYVARQARIMPDGTYQWTASPTGIVWYTTTSWVKIGNVTI